MCVIRWSERLDFRRHIWHWKGFWPGNTLICLFISSFNLYWIVGNNQKNAIKCSYPGIFLTTCVYPDVSREFVSPQESSVALINWTSVWSLVHLDDLFYIVFVFGQACFFTVNCTGWFFDWYAQNTTKCQTLLTLFRWDLLSNLTLRTFTKIT